MALRPRPLGADNPGLSIDGEFTHFFNLPPKARELYRRFAEKGNTRIWQCGTCGYLTSAKALETTTYNQAYECGGCGERLRGTTQNRGTKNYEQVEGPVCDNPFDVLSVHAEGQCDVGGCDRCVPNHPSHLGKLQNSVEGGVSQSEMLQGVAEAVAEQREAESDTHDTWRAE